MIQYISDLVMPSQITPGFGQSDCVDVHVELDVMVLYAGLFLSAGPLARASKISARAS